MRTINDLLDEWKNEEENNRHQWQRHTKTERLICALKEALLQRDLLIESLGKDKIDQESLTTRYNYLIQKDLNDNP